MNPLLFDRRRFLKTGGVAAAVLSLDFPAEVAGGDSNRLRDLARRMDRIIASLELDMNDGLLLNATRATTDWAWFSERRGWGETDGEGRGPRFDILRLWKS
jgi:hypothetical protein